MLKSIKSVNDLKAYPQNYFFLDILSIPSLKRSKKGTIRIHKL